MKRETINRRRERTGNYGERKAEQLRGIFRNSSPFKLVEGGDGEPFETFKRRKKGQLSH